MGTCQGGSIKKLGLFLGFTLCLQAQLPVPLGTAGSFAVLAGAGVTSTGNTVVNGNLGTSPTLSVTGFGPGIVINGAIPIWNSRQFRGSGWRRGYQHRQHRGEWESWDEPNSFGDWIWSRNCDQRSDSDLEQPAVSRFWLAPGLPAPATPW